jgi:hypothetical protein
MPDDSGVLVYSCAPTHFIAHEAAGATGTRHSPRPFLGEGFINDSGASRGEIVKPCLELYQRHCDPLAHKDGSATSCFCSLTNQNDKAGNKVGVVPDKRSAIRDP